MVKIVGIIIIMAGSVLLGLYFGKKETRRIKVLEEIRAALIIIKSEIGFSLSTLNEAMLSAAEKSEKPVSELFYLFQGRLDDKNGENAEELWSESLKSAVSFMNIKAEDIDRLLLLGKTFSSPDKQRVINGIDMLIDYIDSKNEQLRGESAKSIRLYPPLCIFSGLMLIIFLV